MTILVTLGKLHPRRQNYLSRQNFIKTVSHLPAFLKILTIILSNNIDLTLSSFMLLIYCYSFVAFPTLRSNLPHETDFGVFKFNSNRIIYYYYYIIIFTSWVNIITYIIIIVIICHLKYQKSIKLDKCNTVRSVLTFKLCTRNNSLHAKRK